MLDGVQLELDLGLAQPVHVHEAKILSEADARKLALGLMFGWAEIPEGCHQGRWWLAEAPAMTSYPNGCICTSGTCSARPVGTSTWGQCTPVVYYAEVSPLEKPKKLKPAAAIRSELQRLPGNRKSMRF